MGTKVKLLIEIPQERLEVLRTFEKDCPDGLSSRDKIILAGKVYEEPKTGHWVNKSWTMGCGVQVINVTCSCCGDASGFSHMKAPYCPNCGAKMEVE